MDESSADKSGKTFVPLPDSSHFFVVVGRNVDQWRASLGREEGMSMAEWWQHFFLRLNSISFCIAPILVVLKLLFLTEHCKILSPGPSRHLRRDRQNYQVSKILPVFPNVWSVFCACRFVPGRPLRSSTKYVIFVALFGKSTSNVLFSTSILWSLSCCLCSFWLTFIWLFNFL